MRGAFVVMLQIFSALFRDDGNFVLGTGESFESVERFPEKNGDELDIVADLAAEEVAAFESGDLADAGEQFGFEHGLIGVRVFGGGGAVPYASDHEEIVRRRWQQRNKKQPRIARIFRI